MAYQPATSPSEWPKWIQRLLNRGWPTRVYLAVESRSGFPAHESPRFSLCLAGTGQYTVLRQQKRQIITLKRGDAIVAAPGAHMEPHRPSRYLALGLVFTPSMTRLLLAKQSRGRHRFLQAHHDSTVLDSDGHHFFEALYHRDSAPPEDLAARRLVELLLLKSADIASRTDITKQATRKGHFTWQAACQFLEDHLHQPLGRQEVADFLHIHPNHVSRLFHEFSERSFQDHLLHARLRRARSLMADPSLNITDIAHACGFRDANYFIRCYRRVTGETPGRQRTRNNSTW
ncbi:AraC-type DNA-binding protein [Prosthecobacter debontii]|uniref:AraC-type DNA-binding protein n=1 Tax=Prosthecobacter debontii TaxID=48467 RepID=A0A1T4WJ68_9BACT|nr:AraC family transcriptional regulator [Prosthecobacter debontii]SKA77370.1 AraC-type DNA-binding protein [Prosthecobacter debontii]